jgi:CspA family cold shock protein
MKLIDFGRTFGPFRFGTAGRTFRLSLQTSTTRASGRERACPNAHVHLQDQGRLSMTTGTVKFYNEMKGFGFIQPSDGGKDVFVHATALERAGMRNLVEGQKVTFDTAEDRRSGKIAVNNIENA